MITKEPGVFSRNQVIGYSEPTLPPSNVNLSTYVQIVSDTGVSDEPVLITNRTHLLDVFTIDKELKLSSPKCLKEAAYLANSGPLWVQRIAPSVVVGELGKSTRITLMDDSDTVLCNIYHKYANARDLLKVKVLPLDNGVYDIIIMNVVHDPKDEEGVNDYIQFTDSYRVTLDIDSVDQMGLPNSIVTIMEYRNDLEIQLVSPGVIASMKVDENPKVEIIEDQGGSVYFGAYPTAKEDELNQVQKWMQGDDKNIIKAWNDAYQRLLTIDEFTPYFIFSATVPSKDLATDQKAAENALASMSSMLKSLVIYNPYLEDYEYKTVSKLQYPATAEGRLDLPGFVDTSLLGVGILLGGGLIYHELVCAKAAAGKEFIPIMGRAEGRIPNKKLAATYDKDERLDLINKGYSVIRSRKSRLGTTTARYSYYVINNTLRTAVVDDVVSEEQNKRLINQMNIDIDESLEIIVGKFGVDETLQEAEAIVRRYFTDKIGILNPNPVTDFEVVADREINTSSTLRQRRILVVVKVRLGSAVRYVEVLNKIMPTK